MVNNSDIKFCFIADEKFQTSVNYVLHSCLIFVTANQWQSNWLDHPLHTTPRFGLMLDLDHSTNASYIQQVFSLATH